ALPGIGRLSRLIGGEPMASLLAARCQHSAAAFRLHARAEPVRLGAAAPPRLIRALWQSNPPLYYATARSSVSRAMRTAPQPLLRPILEFISVLEPGQNRQTAGRVRKVARVPPFGCAHYLGPKNA